MECDATSTASGLPAANAPSKRDLIVNVFLHQEGHLTADDLYRPDQAGRSENQPRHRLPHAAVDGRGGHRAQGRFWRGPVPLRALVPASAPLSSHLQDLQPLVRVPELGHRGPSRRSGGGAEFHRAPELLQIHGTCEACRTGRAPAVEGGTTELLFARDALRIAIATERSGLEFYSRGARMTKDPRGRRVFEKLAEEEKEHLGKLEARYKELLGPTRCSSPGRPSCFSRERRTASSPRAPNSCQGRRRSTGADDRHPLRARVAPVLQALRRTFEDSEGKRIFLEFADEEREHLELLIREYRALLECISVASGRPGQDPPPSTVATVRARRCHDRSPPSHDRLRRPSAARLLVQRAAAAD